MLPRLQDGQPAALTLIRPQTDAPARLVLRLWATDIRLQTDRGASQPMAIGAVTEERFQRPYGLLTIGRQSLDFNAPRDALAAALNDVRVVRRPEPPEALTLGRQGAAACGSRAGTGGHEEN